MYSMEYKYSTYSLYSRYSLEYNVSMNEFTFQLLQQFAQQQAERGREVGTDLPTIEF